MSDNVTPYFRAKCDISTTLKHKTIITGDIVEGFYINGRIIICTGECIVIDIDTLEMKIDDHNELEKNTWYTMKRIKQLIYDDEHPYIGIDESCY